MTARRTRSPSSVTEPTTGGAAVPHPSGPGGGPGGPPAAERITLGVIEEALRWEPPLLFIMRTAATDVELGGAGCLLDRLPDLVVIDGGLGQVNAARGVMDELGLHDMPVIGLAMLVFVVVNHFSSKGDDQGIFSRWQPPTNFSEPPRHGQAQVVNTFVDQVLVKDKDANVIVLGDINDFEFSRTVEILEGDELTTLMRILPANERYSYVFEGNSQVLDQILFSANMFRGLSAYDVVHVNSEFADQASDHDPSVARLELDD